ncbi:hypothetical protein L1R96_06835 [Klebsiella pneumoniae]|uniref:hypothetical protein n=1 Tax=Klebsiella TaxID=570 RepID=UPI001D189A9E|nr:hypothetical protein [Klebsiella pneumoniae]MCM5764507.1 hypothetical protein [Klebsiella pneumoniae]MCP6000177.1 hypothetical protein [Klebsiella pneumoniae]URU13612.1 hypothetical protein NBY44_02500 [Klebsiella pneumoniae]URU17976.1 hypothetical protein NBY42_22785 [Klebsiella pneumoniae]
MERMDPQPQTENGLWDSFVELALPRVMVMDTREEMEEQREEIKRQALLLAAAALRAAGEFTLADNLLN